MTPTEPDRRRAEARSEPLRALLIGTYEMGRQPFGLASPAAWLRDAGVDVTCVDLTRERLSNDVVSRAGLVAWYLPMHTATRLALPIIQRVRDVNPDAHLCGYGLYAPPNAQLLAELGVTSVLGPEFEADLTDLAVALGEGRPPPAAATQLPRLRFKVPDRGALPPLAQYAALSDAAGGRRLVGYTEASRGCKHTCRHCPIVPVYEGRFRVVAPDVVLADIRAQVEAGARHITFGDPDFFNGPTHAVEIVRRVARTFPDLSYDVTVKVEHLLDQVNLLPTLRDTGCAFVTSAVESFDDRVLEILDKGHTRADVARAVEACRAVGLVLTPTFVPFTPWTTLDTYCRMLEEVAALDLIDAVAPIQLAIRLLLPERSGLLAHAEVASAVGPFQPDGLIYPWRHPDARVDALQADVTALVGRWVTAPRREAFEAVWDLAHERAGVSRPVPEAGASARAAIPYLNEPWYC
ncbi:MAG: CUAEP/CCAEP-tail radical SAM protein [Vicinamibacterales bacterium]|nr:CUAEP/CCAEP-tail radical SAM protein [Vicinamibacterales bacterium]